MRMIHLSDSWKKEKEKKMEPAAGPFLSIHPSIHPLRHELVLCSQPYRRVKCDAGLIWRERNKSRRRRPNREVPRFDWLFLPGVISALRQLRQPQGSHLCCLIHTHANTHTHTHTHALQAVSNYSGSRILVISEEALLSVCICACVVCWQPRSGWASPR